MTQAGPRHTGGDGQAVADPVVDPGPDATDTQEQDDGRGLRRVRAFCAVLVLALAAGLWVAATGPTPEVPVHVVGLVFVLYVVGELFAAEIELRRETHTFAFTSIPLVIGLLFLPIPVLVAVRVAASLIVLGAVFRQELFKLILNLTSHATEVAVAGLVLTLVGVPAELGPRAWLAAGLAVITADLVGAGVITAAISLFQGAWERALLAGAWVPIVVAVVDVSIALLIARGLADGDTAVWLTLPIIVFLVGVTRAYARIVARQRATERLNAFARDLGAAVVDGAVETSLLPSIAEILHAELAWVWSPEGPDGAGHKLVYRTADDRVAREDTTALDFLILELARQGTHRLGRGGAELRGLVEEDITDALVDLVDLGDGRTAVVGVGNRSGHVRSFDREDDMLFRTLCSHAAVSLRNVELVDRLRAESTDNEFLATHDQLTGLPNRVLLHRTIEARLDAAEPVAVLLMDLDRFKEVNDTLGHASGDALLVEIGRRLGAGLEPGVVIARLGGDEFAILLPTADPELAVERARQIRAKVRRPYTVTGVAVDVDSSIGVALPGAESQDASSLLRRADVAMYSAKANHAGVALYAADIDDYSPKRLAVAGRLRSAIDGDELRLRYQPKVDLVTEQVVGVEALVRWQPPGQPEIPPDDFIPIAERTELIHPLTREVLRQAITQAAEWHHGGNPLAVSVNLSARNLVEDDLVTAVAGLLDTERLAPEALEIELTETALMVNPTRAAQMMTDLRALGVRVAIDDFGTGHSSLAYLTALEIDTLKIDRSFISAMGADPAARTIVQAVIDLAGNLGLAVVAEGVETVEAAQALTAMGCATAQGFLFSRPLTAGQLEAWLLDRALDRLVQPPLRRGGRTGSALDGTRKDPALPGRGANRGPAGIAARYR